MSAAKKVTLVEEQPEGSASKWREAVRLRDSAVCGRGVGVIGNHAFVNHCYEKSTVLSEGENSVGISELLDTYSNTGKHRYSARVCECHVTCRHACCVVLIIVVVISRCEDSSACDRWKVEVAVVSNQTRHARKEQENFKLISVSDLKAL